MFKLTKNAILFTTIRSWDPNYCAIYRFLWNSYSTHSFFASKQLWPLKIWKRHKISTEFFLLKRYRYFKSCTLKLPQEKMINNHLMSVIRNRYLIINDFWMILIEVVFFLLIRNPRWLFYTYHPRINNVLPRTVWIKKTKFYWWLGPRLVMGNRFKIMIDYL